MTLTPTAFVDTHTHLDDDQFTGELDVVLARAKAVGVERIINIGYRPSGWKSTLAIAAEHPEIAYTLGMHPNHAEEWSPESERLLLHLIETRRPVAIGEIGLDFFRTHSSREMQWAALDAQLTIAKERSLPVVIHQREAEDELLPILRNTSADLVCVLHSFDGTEKLAAFARERGYYLGVGGLMTRSQASAVREIIKDFPLDRLLLETDSPYLVPSGIKNRRNEPANIPQIAGKLAELKNVSVEEIAAATTSNAHRLFPALLSATTTSFNEMTRVND